MRQLFDERISPVCSPALLERGPPLERPADLANHTLLHVEWMPFTGETQDWGAWLNAAGAGGVDHSRGPRFTHANIALQAAIEGQGVALGSDSVASDDIAAGRLVRPFDIIVPFNFAYYLVYPEPAAEVPKIAAFRDWILAEIATSI